MAIVLLVLALSAGPEIWSSCEVRQSDVWAAAVVAKSLPVVTWPEAKTVPPTCSTGNCPSQKPKAIKPAPKRRRILWRN